MKNSTCLLKKEGENRRKNPEDLDSFGAGAFFQKGPAIIFETVLSVDIKVILEIQLLL